MDKFLESTGNALSSLWVNVQPWAQRNITFGLILAVLTEVPRWTFAFSAAHEPMWAGCALAALMSYAAAHAWEEYFAQHDWLLLLLNSLSLAFGVFTISPVIFAMTSGGGHDADIRDVLSGAWLWAWSIVLASTTFLPLIQVAVVEVRRRTRLQDEPAQPVAHSPKPKAKPVVVQAPPEPLPVVASALDVVTQPNDNATAINDDARLVAIMPGLQSQLDELDTKILDAMRNGAYTPYAISKATGVALTTLKRKQGDKVTGRLPKLVAAGFIHNSSGDDGSEYRLVEV